MKKKNAIVVSLIFFISKRCSFAVIFENKKLRHAIDPDLSNHGLNKLLLPLATVAPFIVVFRLTGWLVGWLVGSPVVCSRGCWFVFLIWFYLSFTSLCVDYCSDYCFGF